MKLRFTGFPTCAISETKPILEMKKVRCSGVHPHEIERRLATASVRPSDELSLLRVEDLYRGETVMGIVRGPVPSHTSR